MKIRYKFFLVFVIITLFSLFINYFIASLGVQKIAFNQTEQTLNSGLNTNHLLIKNVLDDFFANTQRMKVLNTLSSKKMNQDMATLIQNGTFDWCALYQDDELVLSQSNLKNVDKPENLRIRSGEVYLKQLPTGLVMFASVALDKDRVFISGKTLNFHLIDLYLENGQDILLFLNKRQVYSSNPQLVKGLETLNFEVRVNRLIANVTSSGLFILKQNNLEYKANYRSIDVQNGQLKILLLQPTDFENQIFKEMLINLGIFSAFFIFILLIFSYYISRNIISPFQNLMGAIMERSKQSITTLLKRKDEVGEIASQFWQIMDDLYAQQAQKEKVHSLIAHDLKTPLIAISRTLENIRDQDHISREQRINLINMMLKHCNNSLGLITNLLNIQKYELGKTNLFLAKDNLNTLIIESTEGLKPISQSKNIEIQLHLDPHPVPVMLDHMEISRVIKNILSNAIKYTPENGLISLSSKFTAEGVCVAVKDNGYGIPEELQSTIFDFYNRNNQLIKDNSQADLSTGLGLYLCSQIIEAHKGWLKLESEENKGSEFSFFIPHRYSRPLELPESILDE